MLSCISCIHGTTPTTPVVQHSEILTPAPTTQKRLNQTTLETLALCFQTIRTFFGCSNLQEATIPNTDTVTYEPPLPRQDLTQRKSTYITLICDSGKSLLQETKIILAETNHTPADKQYSEKDILYICKSIRLLQINIEDLINNLEQQNHSSLPFDIFIEKAAIRTVLAATYRNLTAAFYNLDHTFPWLTQKRALFPMLGIPKENFCRPPGHR